MEDLDMTKVTVICKRYCEEMGKLLSAGCLELLDYDRFVLFLDDCSRSWASIQKRVGRT